MTALPLLPRDDARCAQGLCPRREDCARFLMWKRDGNSFAAVMPAVAGTCALYISAHSVPWSSHEPNRSTAARAAKS